LVEILPHLNAPLNATAATLLFTGWRFARARREEPHRVCMLSAFGSNFIDKVRKKCGSDYASLFPGSCSSEATLTEFATCIEVRVECRVCLGLNEVDGVDRNCDDFDDGKLNASCP
jgi:hypothetical protein